MNERQLQLSDGSTQTTSVCRKDETWSELGVDRCTSKPLNQKIILIWIYFLYLNDVFYSVVTTCPPLTEVSNADVTRQLIGRESHVLLTCPVGYHFNATRDNTTVVKCLESQWNTSDLQCTRKTQIYFLSCAF